MAEVTPYSTARRQILRAALKHFANGGYAATSVQQIVDTARLSKPALYYHFRDKAGLFEALVHQAHDERYRVLCGAVDPADTLPVQLEKIFLALFDFYRANRDLMRIAFATMFAAPGEMPENLSYLDKCERNFEFIQDLFKRARKKGGLDPRFNCEDLALGFYGMVNFYLVSHLVSRDRNPDRSAARRIVQLFLAGAGPKKDRGKLKVKKRN
jgi:AcrR family transcriptional regulator